MAADRKPTKVTLEQIKATILGCIDRKALFGETEPEDKAKLVGMWDLLEAVTDLYGNESEKRRHGHFSRFNKVGTDYEEE
jgi:hypothetical protein